MISKVRSLIASALANQLIEPLLRDRSVALLVDVEAVRVARRLSVDEHPKRHRGPSLPRAQDEVDVAGVEAERDLPAGAVQHARPLLTVQSPARAHWLSPADPAGRRCAAR